MSQPNGKTVLVVEDEAPLRQAISDILIYEGFNVLMAADGEQGLSEAYKHHPDLILLDVIMPNMNGRAMHEALRAHDQWGHDVPVYLLTNVSESSGITALLENQNTDYLIKANWVLTDVVYKIKGRLGLLGKTHHLESDKKEG